MNKWAHIMCSQCTAENRKGDISNGSLMFLRGLTRLCYSCSAKDWGEALLALNMKPSTSLDRVKT